MDLLLHTCAVPRYMLQAAQDEGAALDVETWSVNKTSGRTVAAPTAGEKKNPALHLFTDV